MAISKSPSFNYRNLMTFVAGSDLSDSKYRFVSVTDGKVYPSLGAGNVHGILVIPAKIGKTVSVLTQPGTKATLELGTATGAVAAGTKLTTNGGATVKDGRGTAQSGTKLTHAIVLGDGLSGTGSKTGKYVEVLFTPNTPAAT